MLKMISLRKLNVTTSLNNLYILIASILVLYNHLFIEIYVYSYN